MQTKVEPVVIGLHVRLCTLYGMVVLDWSHAMQVPTCCVMFLYFVNIEASLRPFCVYRTCISVLLNDKFYM